MKQGRPKEWDNDKPKQVALYVEATDYKLFCEIAAEKNQSFNKSINNHIKKTIKNNKR